MRATAGVLLVVLITVGCSSPEVRTRFSRHFDGEVWTGALYHQVRDPGVYVPEATLLAVLPPIAANDHHLQARMERHPAITRGDSTRGNVTQVGLALAMAAYSGARWGGGDQGRSFEVAAESVLATAAVTSGLKAAVGRHRPHGHSTTSFPSGHSSFCFGAATFLARSIRDEGDGWTYDLGYLAYVPAAYVAINRVESGHHYPADVVAGAFIGTFLTNLIYDAHYGDASNPGIFGSGVQVAPDIRPGFTGISLTLKF